MVKIKAKVRSWNDAKKFLGDKKEKKIAHDTYITWHGSSAYSVVFHKTPIIVFYQTGGVRINSGGYYTVTTRQRINQFIPIPWKVVQRKFEWFLWNYHTDDEYEYEDHIHLCKVNEKIVPVTIDRELKLDKLEKL